MFFGIAFAIGMLQLTIIFFPWYLHLIILIEQNIQIININLNYKVFGKEKRFLLPTQTSSKRKILIGGRKNKSRPTPNIYPGMNYKFCCDTNTSAKYKYANIMLHVGISYNESM